MMSHNEYTHLTIDDIELELLNNRADVSWYNRRESFEEKQSHWYTQLIREQIGTILDVGANYGFISCIIAKKKPEIRVLAIEADPRLALLVEKNLTTNGVQNYKVFNAVATDRSETQTMFSINPRSTLDNRVRMEGWEQVKTAAITLDSLIEHLEPGPVYIKIDTQGFEQRVFKGAETLLSRDRDWIVKAEFAPHWLESQGTDPEQLLLYLVDRYDVYECPLRTLFRPGPLRESLGSKLSAKLASEFVSYVRSLNVNRLGWVDIVVLPKRLNPD